MRILTYKRTHTGDPNPEGRFGINDCMGQVRDYDFDAVIGVGGIGSEPCSYGIDRKINWVGINPTKQAIPDNRGAEVTFEHFVYFEEKGPLLEDLAPNLAKRLFERAARFLISGYSEVELREAKGILEWSKLQKSVEGAGMNNSAIDQVCLSARVSAPKVRKCGC